jgi:hypothetical protein
MQIMPPSAAPALFRGTFSDGIRSRIRFRKQVARNNVHTPRAQSSSDTTEPEPPAASVASAIHGLRSRGSSQALGFPAYIGGNLSFQAVAERAIPTL